MKLKMNTGKEVKKKDYMETKQHATEKSVGQWGNKKEYLERTSRQIIVKTQPYKTYERQQKQFLQGSSQWYRPSSKTKKNLK